MVIAWPADVGVEDGRSVRGTLVRGTPIKLIVEDGVDRTIGARADLDGTLGGGFNAFSTIRTHEPNNAEAGTKALLGMRPLFEDQLAERHCRRADEARIGPDTIDGLGPRLIKPQPDADRGELNAG